MPGDLMACYGADRLGRLIRAKTSWLWGPSAPSHVAMCCDYQGRVVWVESTTQTNRPCMIRGGRVDGAQVHLPHHRIADYASSGGRVDVWRLAKTRTLADWQRAELSRVLIDEIVRPGTAYDYGGAGLSGLRFLPWTWLYPSADLERVFCSELCAEGLMSVGRMPISVAGRWNPGRLLRWLCWWGVYRFLRSYDQRLSVRAA